MDTPVLTLASASPRRRRLLPWIDVPFDAVATDTPEDLSSPLKAAPPVLARSLAADKARAARALLGDAAGVIVAFDTVVVLDRAVLGKPADADDARRMLRALSGRMHHVVTGVAILTPERTDPQTFAVTSDVEMRDLDETAIEEWLAGDEALGCAGAYNIEAHLGSVSEDTCYQNVAGLPLCHLYQRLSRLGVEGLALPNAACDAALGRTCALGPRACTTPGL
jgi:septum formation protein